MTLDEKILMLHGPPSGPCCQCNTSALCAYVGNVAPIPRLDIPPITMNDGPQGFRDNGHPQTTTAWPSGLTMAASWDVDALHEWGVGMGKEFYAKGSNVQLGPGVCVARVPRNGRNFEYLSGEDPFLGYTLVQPAIRGIQSQKVVANAKHWVLNNQETNRFGVSAEADERTRFEMYYPPFEGAVEADVGSFMCGYNKINGDWSCENPVTLKHDLKEVMGFKGYVMSDWGATHSTSLMRGLDMEMPSAKWMNASYIKPDLAAGTITTAGIDDAITRILRPMFSVGVMDEPVSTWDWKRLEKNVTTDISLKSARHLAAISTVLLKNDDAVLPLPQNKKLALLGFAGSNAVVHGGGSGSVVPSFVASPLAGISAEAGDGAKVEFNNGTDIAAAAALASSADYAIVFAGTLSHEGGDRDSLSLDDGCTPDQYGQCQGNHDNQNALIEAVAKANSKTIVVLSVPGAVLTPWAGKVAAIVTNFMPGQQAGNAIADVLFGKVNPSGKLPITFPNHENEIGFSQEQWPGIENPKSPTYAYYSEKLLVGYRYYDAHNITFSTGFPFGHGISYTTFEYSGLTVNARKDSAAVTFSVKNTGKVPGAEVAQLYLSFPAEAGEPPRQLKGFEKTKVLGSGEVAKVVKALRPRDFSIWDVTQHAWKVVPGEYRLSVGTSSRDLRLHTTIDMKQDSEQLVV
jgi:beta-glucosidase